MPLYTELFFPHPLGITPVPWILLGEWFVSETRSIAGGIASAMFFLSALISLQVCKAVIL